MERITLNIIPKGITPVCHASQFDIGRVIRCDIMDDLQGYVFSDETVELRVCKPDNNIVTANVDVVSGDTFVLIETTEQMTACDGVNKCELRIMKGNVRIGSLNFDMKVEVDPLKDGVESETVIHNLESIVDGMVAEDVAEQYDSSNVIFDNEPTENHGNGYTVTSEGIKTAIDNAFDYDNTASGSLVHITDGADNIPVKSLVSEIVAVESGSGEKSPENPYTISGFAQGIVSVCGVNLWNEQLELGYYSSNGAKVSTTNQLRTVNKIMAKPSTAYYFKIPVSTYNAFAVIEYDENGDFIRRVTPSSYSGDGAIYTTSADCYYFNINIGSSYGNVYLNNISINYPSSDTQYHAYNGNTYTFTFGQTVYGGHFDNKGNLVVTHGFGELVAVSKNGNYFRATLSDLGLPNIYDRNADLLCDRYAVADVTTTTSNNNQITVYGEVGDAYAIRWVDLNYLNADVSTYNTAMASNKPKICYKLLNPITLAITSQDIPTLLGENNIYANTGDIDTLIYYVDTEAIYAIRDVIDEFAMQSDWNEADNTKADYIKNKPTIPTNADFSLSGLSDTDISGESFGQVLAFDGDNWVNTNQIAVKYEEIDVTLDASGEGTLFNSVKFVVGLKDIPSDQLYVAYVSYINVDRTMVKAFSRSAIAFSSQSNVSSTRKVGVYYLDNIATP